MKGHAVVVAMLALASCDQVFGLSGRDDKPVDGDDGGVDALEDDANGGCPVAANPLDDDDGDQIPNQSDLCPMKADRGNNEDGDCAADACDLCPHLTGTFADPEDDLIGDGCDFKGTSATFDTRVFEGFDNDDELHLFEMEIDHSAAQLRNPKGQKAFGFSNEEFPTTFQIETRFVIPTGPGSWSVGLIFGATAPVAAPSGWAVTVSQVTASELRLRFFQVTAGMFLAQNADRILAATGSLRLGVRVEGQDIAILTTMDGQETNTELIAFPGTLPGGLQQPTYWGVTATGPAIVAFDYMTGLHH